MLASLFGSFSMSLVLMLLGYDSALLYYRVACKATAFLAVFSLLVKLLFTVWLTFHLFAYVVFLKNLKRLEWLYISCSIAVPLLGACVPLTHDGYGVSGGWCSIRTWKGECANEKSVEGIVEVFAIYYGPVTFFLLLNMAAIAVMIAVMLWRARSRVSLAVRTAAADEQKKLLVAESRDQKVEALKQLLPLLAYPIIYFTLLLFALTNRIYMVASDSKEEWLVMVHGATQASMGMFSALALAVHICVIKKKKKKKKKTPTKLSTEDDHLSTFTGVTPYTSGAATLFSAPIEE